ncbi:hypothetical protein [Azospirillum halopraeferens]|uniref:hypothetical protein n=1 Tax=Azospirillum halopraeferens TaxID=34010 RepID=UPI0012EC522A|nr:hypothetical protein [Azospirillum halopraeferens]
MNAIIGRSISLVLLVALGVFPCNVSARDDDETADAELGKVEFALSCGARFGVIEDVKVLLRNVDSSGYVVLKGKYLQRLSIGGRFGPFDQSGGSEYTGTFVAIFDQERNVRKVSWNISMRSGDVPARCLDR